MNDHFWSQLPRPFFVLAPMEDVTDAAFRRIIAKYGKPDALFTEFVSVDGIVSEKGRDRVLKDLTYDESERPIVAQLFGSTPKHFYEAAKIVAGLGFDGIDINMGCPDRAVIKQGAGSALIKEPGLAQEIIIATREAAGNKPVSVKTRLGFNAIEIDTWIPALLEAKPAAITIHGRTKKEMSKVPAHWDYIAKVAIMAREQGVAVIGNGDVQNIEEGIEKAHRFGVDGIMIGRGVFGNPWCFNREVKKSDHTIGHILNVLVEHTELFEDLLGSTRHFMLMRKHFASYLKNYPHTRDLKMALMETNSAAEVRETIKMWLARETSASFVQ